MKWRLVATLLTGIAVAAIVSTYHVFNNMYDEPATVATGMEWLSKGAYTYEPQHPPLARVAGALGPYLAGARSFGINHMYSEGRAILGEPPRYQRMLTLARLGELPFFVVLAFVVWLSARRLSDERIAAVAVFFAVTNPNLLAHSGVAGIDIAPAALMPAALYAFARWLERPRVQRGLVFGLLFALCGLSKFSGVAYLIPAMLLTALLSRSETTAALRAPRAGLSVITAIALAAMVTWATYRFSFRGVPAPEFFAGLRAFFRHGTSGHPAFLLGEVSTQGWWYYDFVVLLVKTPIPLLIFAAVGIWRSWRGPRTALAIAPLCGVVSVMVIACITPVDLGVRLILPVYPLLAILAALGVQVIWERVRQSSTRFLVTALLVWAAAEPVIIHPDHIAYFNLFAGPNPEHVLVDSNLDWGQDLYRLRDAAIELKVDSLRVHYFGTAEFTQVGLLRTRRLRPYEHVKGWVAASETFYAGVWADTALNWLHAQTPLARIGRSIRLYYIK